MQVRFIRRIRVQSTDTATINNDFSMARSPLLLMIGNAHLDPAWMWEWGEGMEAFAATCRSALDRMEETPEFVFTCSSAAHYHWIELTDPPLFRRIADRVAEGRWEVVGGWWTQADCNLPSGEGFLRQGLLGQRYFIEKFGRAATVGYSPDAFGHNAGLPQLLRAVGLDAYIFCRPDPSELVLPSPLFRWFSADGSSVPAYRVPLHYNMYQTSVPKKVEDMVRAFNGPSDLAAGGRPLREFGREWGVFYGVGNHGGGPTKEHIRQIIAIDADPEKPDVRFSRLDDFLNRSSSSFLSSFSPVIEREGEGIEEGSERIIPEWRDDLQLNAPGCYSVHTAIKRLNRRAEHELVRAEIVQSMETLLAADSGSASGRSAIDDSDLTRAWRNVCFNHFHDILCGVAIPEALDAALHLYGESLSIADRITRYALRRIANRIDTTGVGQTLLVLNPHSFDLDDYVTFELWHDIDKELWSQPVHLCVTDDDGNEIAAQPVFTSGKIGKDRVGARFRAQVPAMGWRCYRVHYGVKGEKAEEEGLMECGVDALENAFLRVEFSATSGAITRILHKESGLDLIAVEAAMPTVIRDLTDTWGHGVTRFDQEIGRFDLADVRLVECGPGHGTVRVNAAWGNSRIQQDFTLHAGSPKLEVRVRINWNEPQTMLKLAFPTSLINTRTVVEGAYTVVEKPCDGTERPGGAWKSIVGEREGTIAGIGIADTLTHGYSALEGPDGAALFLSILRSPGYALHDPHVVDPDEDVRYIDMGEVEFRYTLRPFAGEECRTLLSRDAALLNAPPLLSLESAHTGGPDPLPRTYRGVDISAPNVRATVLQRSGEGEGWSLRLYETEGKETTGTVRLHLAQTERQVEMRPHEVRTLREIFE